MTTSPDFKYILGHPARFVAFGFGSGLSPFAPGTAGTLAAIPLFWLLMQLEFPPVYYFSLLAVLFAVGVWASAHVGRELGVVDYGGIVWDEVVAFLAILYFTPYSWMWWGVAFFVFRVFDVWKPFPIRWFDTNIKNGFGVMFDDIAAIPYSVLTIKLLVWLING